MVVNTLFDVISGDVINAIDCNVNMPTCSGARTGDVIAISTNYDATSIIIIIITYIVFF